ncbi:hypothetical protein [Nocardia xishanensis]
MLLALRMEVDARQKPHPPLAALDEDQRRDLRNLLALMTEE